jgi:hypothetical protein
MSRENPRYRWYLKFQLNHSCRRCRVSRLIPKCHEFQKSRMTHANPRSRLSLTFHGCLQNPAIQKFHAIPQTLRCRRCHGNPPIRKFRAYHCCQKFRGSPRYPLSQMSRLFLRFRTSHSSRWYHEFLLTRLFRVFL